MLGAIIHNHGTWPAGVTPGGGVGRRRRRPHVEPFVDLELFGLVRDYLEAKLTRM